MPCYVEHATYQVCQVLFPEQNLHHLWNLDNQKKKHMTHHFLEILSIQPPASQTNHGKRSSNLQMFWKGSVLTWLEKQGNPLRLRVEICDDLSNPKEEWKNIELYEL